MTEQVNREALRHDAEIELGREDGDCLLSWMAYHEGVLTVLARLSAAEDALRDAEAQLSNGCRSASCNYALGIIRAALAATKEDS